MRTFVNQYILCFFISLLFWINFLYSAEISISPNNQTLACQSSYDFFIKIDTSGNNVLASDIKFFLNWFDFISVQNQGVFDHLNYVWTWVSTKWSNSWKVYYYINVYQNSFGNFVSGSNIFVAKIKLVPKLWHNTWSIVFYNLFENDEDSNISVWTWHGMYDMPLKYDDSLLNTIDGNYIFATCPSISQWGGGWWFISKDNCCINWWLPWWNELCEDLSDSYYDWTCLWWYHGSADICWVNQSKYSDELKWAYLYSYKYWITTMCPIWEADLDWYLYRNHFAKMISEYAMNVLWKTPDIWKEWCDKFADVKNDTDEMKKFMKTACELNLMWMRADGINPMENFYPHRIVTRAEFGTVFSRLLFGEKYNIKDESLVYKNDWYWYKDHLNALKENSIMTKIDWNWPKYDERRWWVMLMMLRADKYWVFFGKIPTLMWIKALLD